MQGYDQLKGIHRHLSARKIPDPYLDELRGLVQTALETTAAQAEGVRQARTFLTEVEHYLASAPRPTLEADAGEADLLPGSDGVREELEEMFGSLEEQEDVDPTTLRLLDKWNRMSETWLPGILHCYDIAGLPRHNLKLEGAFGDLRRHQRRVSGRKETTPLRIFGPGEIMVQILDEEEILPWLRSVPPEEYWAQQLVL